MLQKIENVNKQTKLSTLKKIYIEKENFVKSCQGKLVKRMGFPGNYSSRAAKAAVRMWQLAPMKLNKQKTPALDSPGFCEFLSSFE